MGFMDFMLGGTKTHNTNTSEMDDMARNMYQNADPGLGMAGKMAKGYLKKIRGGRLDELPSVMLSQAQGATDWKELQRGIQMNTAMMPGQQQGLTAGLLSKGFLANQDNAGHRALQGAANDISNFSNIFSMARGQRIDAAQRGQEQGLLGMQRGRSVQKTGGFMDILKGLSGATSQLGMGFNSGSSSSGGAGIGGGPAGSYYE